MPPNDRKHKHQSDAPAREPNANVAGRPPGPEAEDRPGFDLGGAVEPQPSGPTTGSTIPGAPRGRPVPGGGATGRAEGRSNLSGSRSLGNAGEPGSAAGGGSTDGSDKPD